MSAEILQGNTLSGELLFLLSTIEPDEPFQLSGRDCAGMAGFLQHIAGWGDVLERSRQGEPHLGGAIRKLARVFEIAAEGEAGLSLDRDGRLLLRDTLAGLYRVARADEAISPFPVRFPDWRVPAERPANDQPDPGEVSQRRPS